MNTNRISCSFDPRATAPRPLSAKQDDVGFREHDSRIRYHVNGDSVQNFGDYLPELFAKTFLLHPRVESDVYRLIGSVIDPVWILKDLRQQVGLETGTVVFWGCGMRSEAPLPPKIQALCQFFGARGPRTRAALGLDESTVLGDPGLLTPLIHSPSASAVTSGRIICMPHIHDSREDRELLAMSGAELVVRPKVLATEVALREVLDKLVSAQFVLTASLHGAIVAAAYGTPFAFWDNGHLDVPFKWQDFADSVHIPCEFVHNAGQGQAFYRDSIAPSYTSLSLTRILDVCPFAVRPTILLKAFVHDGSVDEDSATRFATIFEKMQSFRPSQVRRLQQASACYRERLQNIGHLARRRLGELREVVWQHQPEAAKALLRVVARRPAPHLYGKSNAAP